MTLVKTKTWKIINREKNPEKPYTLFQIYGSQREIIFSPRSDIHNKSFKSPEEAEAWLIGNAYRKQDWILVREPTILSIQKDYTDDIPEKDYALFVTDQKTPEIVYFIGVSKAKDAQQARHLIHIDRDIANLHALAFCLTDSKKLSARAIMELKRYSGGDLQKVVPVSEAIFDSTRTAWKISPPHVFSLPELTLKDLLTNIPNPETKKDLEEIKLKFKEVQDAKENKVTENKSQKRVSTPDSGLRSKIIKKILGRH